jgi:F-type H+-transporting ATPase subunit alpha
MTELSIRPDEIRDALQRFVSDYKPESATKEEVGTVAEAADGIARVSGLPSVMANELLEFEDGTLGAGHRPQPRHPRGRRRGPG